MPQDPNLYGQRPAKRLKRGKALSTSLDFEAQLASLVSGGAGSSATTSGRSRPSGRPKEDIFRSGPKKPAPEGGRKLRLKEPAWTEEEARELAHATRKMEDKARRYAAMKRGDYIAGENEAEPLVDFDRKWADKEDRKDGYASSTTSSSSDDSDGDGEAEREVIEWDDEFGRRRRGTRADKEKMERNARRGLLGAEDLERMSARPLAPSKLIYGDTVQSMAFNPDDADKMEALARKRDRSMTPPEATHYDADKEMRTKGVGFYKFSKADEARAQELAALAEERARTEQERQTREDQKQARRQAIEQRRRDVGARRAQRQADSFLDTLDDG